MGVSVILDNQDSHFVEPWQTTTNYFLKPIHIRIFCFVQETLLNGHKRWLKLEPADLEGCISLGGSRALRRLDGCKVVRLDGWKVGRLDGWKV